MLHKPGVEEILRSVLDLLQQDILPAIDKDSKISLLLIINALKIVSREITLLDSNEEREIERLNQIVGESGTIATLNQILAEKIATGNILQDDPLLVEHLIKTTLESLAIDQPGYVNY